MINQNKRLDFKAINIAIVIYSALYVLGMFIQEPLQQIGLIKGEYIPVFATIHFPSIVLISGYLCGRLTKEKGFYNGAVVGIASIFVGMIGIASSLGIEVLAVRSPINIIGLFFPLFLGGLGGALAHTRPKR